MRHKNNRQISVYFTEPVLKKLNKKAGKEQCSIAHVIRNAVCEHLKIKNKTRISQISNRGYKWTEYEINMIKLGYVKRKRGFIEVVASLTGRSKAAVANKIWMMRAEGLIK